MTKHRAFRLSVGRDPESVEIGSNEDAVALLGGEVVCMRDHGVPVRPGPGNTPRHARFYRLKDASDLPINFTVRERPSSLDTIPVRGPVLIIFEQEGQGLCSLSTEDENAVLVEVAKLRRASQLH